MSGSAVPEGTFGDLSKMTIELVRRLGWHFYHTPENVTLFLVAEAAELAELFVWAPDEGPETEWDEHSETKWHENVEEEIADVLKCVFRLADAMQLTSDPKRQEMLTLIVLQKLDTDAVNFPVEAVAGKSRHRVLQQLKDKKDDLKPDERFPDAPTDVPETLSYRDFYTDKLQEMACRFAEARRWTELSDQLALAICKSCGDVATCFQRRKSPEKRPYQRTVWALADILINVMRLCGSLGIKDVFPLVVNRLESDEKRMGGR